MMMMAVSHFGFWCIASVVTSGNSCRDAGHETWHVCGQPISRFARYLFVSVCQSVLFVTVFVWDRRTDDNYTVGILAPTVTVVAGGMYKCNRIHAYRGMCLLRNWEKMCCF